MSSREGHPSTMMPRWGKNDSSHLVTEGNGALRGRRPCVSFAVSAADAQNSGALTSPTPGMSVFEDKLPELLLATGSNGNLVIKTDPGTGMFVSMPHTDSLQLGEEEPCASAGQELSTPASGASSTGAFFYRQGDRLQVGGSVQQIPRRNADRHSAQWSNQQHAAKRISDRTGTLVTPMRAATAVERISSLQSWFERAATESDELAKPLQRYQFALRALRRKKLEEREQRNRETKQWAREERRGSVLVSTNDLNHVDFELHLSSLKQASLELGFSWDKDDHEFAQFVHTRVQSRSLAGLSTEYCLALVEEKEKRRSGLALARGEALATMCAIGPLGSWDEGILMCRARLALHAKWGRMRDVREAALAHAWYNSTMRLDCPAATASVSNRVNKKQRQENERLRDLAKKVQNLPSAAAAAAADAGKDKPDADEKRKRESLKRDAAFDARLNDPTIPLSDIKEWTSRRGWGGREETVRAALLMGLLASGNILSEPRTLELRASIREYVPAGEKLLDQRGLLKAHQEMQDQVFEEFVAVSTQLYARWRRVVECARNQRSRELELMVSSRTYSQYVASRRIGDVVASREEYYSHIPRAQLVESMKNRPVYETAGRYTTEAPDPSVQEYIYGTVNHQVYFGQEYYRDKDVRPPKYRALRDTVGAARLYDVRYIITTPGIFGSKQVTDGIFNETLALTLQREQVPGSDLKTVVEALRARLDKESPSLNVQVGPETELTVQITALHMLARAAGNARAMSWFTATRLSAALLCSLVALLLLCLSIAGLNLRSLISQSFLFQALSSRDTAMSPPAPLRLVIWPHNSSAAPNGFVAPHPTFQDKRMQNLTEAVTSGATTTNAPTTPTHFTAPQPQRNTPRLRTEMPLLPRVQERIRFHKEARTRHAVRDQSTILWLISCVICIALMWLLFLKRRVSKGGSKATGGEPQLPRGWYIWEELVGSTNDN